MKLRNADSAQRGARSAREDADSRAAAGRRPDDYDDHDLDAEDGSREQRPRRGTRSTGGIRQGGSGRGAAGKGARRGGRKNPAKKAADAKGAESARARNTPPGGTRRAARPKPGTGAVDQVSRFSASALSKVTVLGDRPGQMVYSLAEQSRRKRGTYVLVALLIMAVLSLLALLAVLILQLVAPEGSANRDPAPIVAPPAGHSTLRPELFHAQDQQDIFAPITERAGDAEPLTQEQVFGSVQELSLSGMDLSLRDSEVTDTCTSLVWGDELAQNLSTGSCSSAARGVYQDADGEYVAQFTLFDLADADAASTTLESLDPRAEPGFVLPMNDGIDGLHRGYSQATAQAMGHYVAVFWVARADGEAPSDDDSMATLNVAAMDAALMVYEQVRDASEEE
ncbi:hypothetical protein [Actinorugispora endophytica]|uniref:Uncharacterized protein n=1 Tax=Actinorugispora endophytica TaxID=1605990 RepID=A0A4R6UY26_9ACTN|nr:hypothetical protein [Actinorugispora endophytica]TDQ48524.1 hypothetical protein EV190_11860 [Actinorugispora endophytica]